MLQPASPDTKKATARGNSKRPTTPAALPAAPVTAPGNQTALRLYKKCDCGGGPDCNCDMGDDKKKKKDEKDSPTTGLHRAAAGSSDSEIAPPIVHEVLRSPGQTLDAATRAFFEDRFNRDFRGVRIHTDSRAAQSARSVNAHAYTVGSNIAFAATTFSPGTNEGRRLLAHELAHVAQQGEPSAPTPASLPIGHPNDAAERAADSAAHSALAGTPVAPAPRSSPAVARQIPGQQQREPDPGCPPEKPYRIAPKTGPGEADPAVVPVCSATPISTTPDRNNPLIPKQTDDGNPTQQPQPPADQTAPNQPGQTAPPPAQTADQQKAEDQKATPAKDSGDGGKGVDFSDDPLADYDDPNSIRVRPGPVRTTLIRPRPSAVKPPVTDCDSLFERQTIAQFGKNFGPWDGAAVAKTVDATFQACPLAYVQVNVRENPKGDDPHGDAVERAMALEDELVKRIGENKYTPDRYSAGSMSTVSGSAPDPNEADIEVDLGSAGKVSYGTGSSSAPPSDKSADAKPGEQSAGSTQRSAQASYGGVQHIYTSPSGPSDPKTEQVVQFQAAITKALHGKDQNGREDQIFVGTQYSLTTKQLTLFVGGQVAGVFQLSDTLQASLFAQLQLGQNITSGQAQAAGAVGAQLQWQPFKWLAVVGQATAGPVSQPGGPSSVDLGYSISIQIMK
jgi:hypothetical protein